MVNVTILGQRISIVAGGVPANKGKMFMKRVPHNAEHPSFAQAQARLALSEYGVNNLTGQNGTVVLPDGKIVSRPAYMVMTQYPHTGVGAFGGMTADQRAAMRHEMAAASIKMQRTRLESMRASIRGPTGARMPSIPM